MIFSVGCIVRAGCETNKNSKPVNPKNIELKVQDMNSDGKYETTLKYKDEKGKVRRYIVKEFEGIPKLFPYKVSKPAKLEGKVKWHPSSR